VEELRIKALREKGLDRSVVQQGRLHFPSFAAVASSEHSWARRVAPLEFVRNDVVARLH